jgi:hypothetical protein
VRQVLGAVAQFQKAELVAKLAGARRRKGRLGGRKPMAALNPDGVAAAKRLEGKSLREISAALAAQGFVSASGNPFAPSTIKSMLRA